MSAASPRRERLHGGVGVGLLASTPMDPASAIVDSAHAERRDQHGLVSVTKHAARPAGAAPHAPGWFDAIAAVTSDLAFTSIATPSSVAAEHDGTTLRFQVRIPAPTSYYGAGLAAGPLLRDGRALTFWNSDAWRYGAESPALYQSHPYVLAVRADGSALGILAASARRGSVAIAPDGVEFAFETDALDVHVIAGADPLAVQRELSRFVGRIELPPLWALGYHQCRWGYRTADEVLAIARELRARRIPCDAIWLDIDHMDRHRVFTWDPKAFPRPRELTDRLHAIDLRAVAILDPGIAIDHPLAEDGRRAGHFVRDRAGEPIRGRVWPGVCHFPDFLSGRASAWWSERAREFVASSGVDGLWCDMNEPALFRTPTKTLPRDARHEHRGAEGDAERVPHADVHNVYGLLMARATRTGLRAADTERRPFVLTRANHLFGSSVAATWTGDNQATWDDLRWTIPMVLNLALSGQPFSGPDIGGFDGDPDAELFVRWFELGALLPFCRGHSERSACRKEPWSFGAEAEAHVRAALERRMRFLPLLYSLFRACAGTGLPPMRPLFFADPADARLRAVDDQFLLGDDVLVAPVVRAGETERRVLLPRCAGGWYPLEAGGRVVTGAETTARAPLGTLPLFARAGSVIVLAAPVRCVRELAGAAREVQVFLDVEGGAAGSVYEDAGEGQGHLRGESCLTTFRARAAPGGRVRLSVSREGGWRHAPRGQHVVVHARDGSTREARFDGELPDELDL